jgi:hypothetical protein
LRCAIEDFASGGAEDPEGEMDLLRALAAAAEEWPAPFVFTVGGARTAVPALRWRCIVKDIVIVPLQAALMPFTAPERGRRGAFVDLAEDFEFRYVRPTPGPASICDAVGLHFTEAFESWRHHPIAVAGILAVSAATCLAVRLMHEGSASRSDSARFVDTLRDEIEGSSREAPWLKTLLGDFRIHP